MPTRNRPGYVGLSLGMFLSQSYGPRELIIVDDGDEPALDPADLPAGLVDISTHDREGRTLLHLETDAVVRVFEFAGTTGAKLNFAARQAGGELLVRWDDDDWQHPERIAAQVDHLESSGKSMAGLASMVFYCEGSPHGWEYFGEAWSALGTSQAFRRDWLLANPIPNRTIGEDSAIARKAREQGEIFTVAGLHNLIVARDHRSNTGNRSTEAQRESPNCENFLKVALGEWYATVAPWVDDPLEPTPIVRRTKTDWEAFAERVGLIAA